MLNPKIHEKISHSFYIDKRDKKKKKYLTVPYVEKVLLLRKMKEKNFQNPQE
jgi:hypothetical protein